MYCSGFNSPIRFNRHWLLFYCCIYCSCFNSLIRFNRHCLLFYSVYIVHVSTLLFAFIVTTYYFILYILFMFQLSYSFKSSLLTILFCIYCLCFNSLVRFNRHCLLFYLVYIVHVSTLLFALIVTAYYFTAVYIVHVSTLLFALIVTGYYFTVVYIVHVSTLLFVLIVTAYYFILYILFMFQLSYSLSSSLLTILFCIYCSCFNSLIRLNRHCLLFYSVYIVYVSTLLFALIVTAYYFILYILFMFQRSYSL